MGYWAEFGAWEERHKELVREAEHQRMARGLREARKARAEERSGEDRTGLPEDIEVRWGLLEDEAGIADLLELNGMPIAFEERYIVAEKDGEILAALRYRTEPKRLLLGLLVSDLWAEELAREMGVGEVLARPFPHGDYPREAGYRRRARREWRLDARVFHESRKEFPAGGWHRVFALFGIFAVPFSGAFSARK